jgi:uncharacterized protein (DUF1800 family)
MRGWLEPFRPSRENPWDFAAAAHLWRRAGFSAPPAQVEASARLAPEEAAAEIARGPAEDPATAELESIYPTVLALGSADALRAWLVARMLRCGHQLREKVALFWHGHFATSILKVRDPVWMARQYRLFLDLGLGPFGRLLEAVTRDPAMIRWLDNDTNRKGHPNENFARELFELFTLGPGNYTEHDIAEAARAFTGWHVRGDAFHFARALHDGGTKRVLGREGAWNGDDVCRFALEEPACGRFLAGKLLRFFVRPDPPAEAVEELGALLREGGYDVARALERLFASRLFFDPASRRALVKSPAEFLVGAARSLGVAPDAGAVVAALRETGQELLAPPNVKGWPGHRDWINTATWMTRVNAARELTRGLRPASSGIDALSRAVLGEPLPPAARAAIDAARLAPEDAAHALLALPEAHLG